MALDAACKAARRIPEMTAPARLAPRAALAVAASGCVAFLAAVLCYRTPSMGDPRVLERTVVGTMARVQTALRDYRQRCGRYPESLRALVADPGGAGPSCAHLALLSYPSVELVSGDGREYRWANRYVVRYVPVPNAPPHTRFALSAQPRTRDCRSFWMDDAGHFTIAESGAAGPYSPPARLSDFGSHSGGPLPAGDPPMPRE